MRILLIGFGVVGRELVQLLDQRRADIYAQCGLHPRLVGVVDSRGAAVSESGLQTAELLAAKKDKGTVAAVPDHGLRNPHVETLIAEIDADLLIEATPTVMSNPGPAITHLKAAFRHGMHAITVNKAPLATAMPGLLELAQHNQVEFRFSGTVGAGTPVLTLARLCARGDEIVRVQAILNGTTNYILSEMHDTGTDFDAALAAAQRLGYAEADPSADIDGIDTATKIVIFANWVCGRSATLSDVQIKGIRGMSKETIEKANIRGQSIKLIGEISDEGLSVQPADVPRSSPLDVSANLNAVTITLRHSGDVTLVGRGAGGPETAVAILRDMLDIWQTAS